MKHQSVDHAEEFRFYSHFKVGFKESVKKIVFYIEHTGSRWRMDFRSKTTEGDQLGDLYNIQVTDNEGLNKGDNILEGVKGAGIVSGTI